MLSRCLVPLVVLGAAGCMTSGVHESVVANTCKAEPGQRFVSRVADAAAGATLLAATHSVELRWVAPGTIVTADYRFGRLTVDLDKTNTITRIACG